MAGREGVIHEERKEEEAAGLAALGEKALVVGRRGEMEQRDECVCKVRVPSVGRLFDPIHSLLQLAHHSCWGFNSLWDPHIQILLYCRVEEGGLHVELI